MREGGRGRGLERRDVANRSVRFGSGFEFGVVGTGMPFALPRPLWRDTGVTGAVGREEMGGGVEGGAGAEPLEAGSCTAACGGISVRALLARGLRVAAGDCEITMRSSSGDTLPLRPRF